MRVFIVELSGPARLHHYKTPHQGSFPRRIPRPLHLRHPLLHFVCPPQYRTHGRRRPRTFGGWRECIGCSMSSSATTCRAIEPDTEPKTWPSSAASPSVSCAPIAAREASKHAESAQAGTQVLARNSPAQIDVNLDSVP